MNTLPRPTGKELVRACSGSVSQRYEYEAAIISFGIQTVAQPLSRCELVRWGSDCCERIKPEQLQDLL